MLSKRGRRIAPSSGRSWPNGNAERYDRDRLPMRETSHDDTDSSRLLANCHRTNDARGGGGNRGDICRLALRLLN
jgi:hypothetical protein